MLEPLHIPASHLENLGALSTVLLAWYDTNKRDFPWRADPIPYHIWVSEIMAQQTRIDTVLKYFHPFIQTFPTIKSLAEGEEHQVLKLWEGLGYYNRARNLQRGAQLVMKEFQGQLPPDYNLLLTIPGIGEYTGGAIASTAFQLPVPAVDGNVYRVLSRVVESTGNISTSKVQKAFRQLALQLLPHHRPGDFNQSLMAVGARICRPTGYPYCSQCPLEPFCRSAHQDWVLDLPVKNPSKARVVEKRTILILRHHTEVLLTQRPPQGLLAGLWQPLNLLGHLKKEEAERTVQELGGTVLSMTPLPTARHIFSHIQWEMKGWLVNTAPFSPTPPALWTNTLDTYTLPTAFKAYRPFIDQRFK